MKILFSNYRIHMYLDTETPMHRKLIEYSLGFISFNISALFNLMWLQQCQKTAGLICADLRETLKNYLQYRGRDFRQTVKEHLSFRVKSEGHNTCHIKWSVPLKKYCLLVLSLRHKACLEFN